MTALPQLSPDALSWLKTMATNNKTVLLKTVQVGNVPIKCPNCNDTKTLWFQLVLAGPYSAPSGKMTDLFTWDNDGWYIVEDHNYPCPCCVNRDTLIHKYWADSGLEQQERDYTVTYCKGMDGKDLAVNMGLGIMAQIPLVTGWYTLHGSYGVGKSGILKALVSACIKAAIPAHYTTADGILRVIKDTYGADNNNLLDEQDLFNLYGNYRLLAIDEFDGINFNSLWTVNTLKSLLDMRSRRQGYCATVFASNLAPEQLHPSFGYLRSRLMEGNIVYMNGKDLRQDKDKETWSNK